MMELEQLLPGMTFDGATIVASVIYSDDDEFAVETEHDTYRVAWTLLLLRPVAPYFEVVLIEARHARHEGVEPYEVVMSGRYENIVPAVDAYQKWGGDY